jgi:hypothetical protein
MIDKADGIGTRSTVNGYIDAELYAIVVKYRLQERPITIEQTARFS